MSEAVIFWGRGYWAFSSARRVHFLLFLRQNLHYLWDKFRMFPQRFQKLFIGHIAVHFLFSLSGLHCFEVCSALSAQLISKNVNISVDL